MAAYGRYEVRGEIGDGSMGRVFRGFDPRFGRPVAIKTIKSEYLTRDTRDEYLRRFRREAPAAGRLSNPNIVTVYDCGEDYLVMELVPGVTLKTLLTQRRLGVDEALDLLAPLAEALDCAHRAGIVHRDLKPVNIMIQPDGSPKLMDFGIAHLDTSLITVPGHVLGSPAYMAPELLRGEEATFRADLFSFATVAYEVLTNHKPFEGDTVSAVLYKVVHEPLLSPRVWRPELPEAFDGVFGRALAKAPERRFPTARAFVAALRGQGAVETDSLSVPEGPAGPPVTETLPLGVGRPRARRWSWLLGATAMVLAAAGGAGLQQLRNDRARVGGGSGTLRIETIPPGAAVWLDGLAVGRSPVELTNLRPGPRQLRILEDGYAPAEVRLELAEGAAAVPLRFAMSPTAARLAVRSEPDGATVSVDGRAIGTTPLERALLDPGRHEVRVGRPGLVAQTRRVEAKAGQSLLVAVRLEPPPPEPVRPRASLLPSPSPRPTPLVEGALVAIDETVIPPTRIEGRPASYPKKAKKLKLRGSVLVETVVTAKGEPTDIRVLESAGAVLDEAVVDAVRRWRFEPARKGGVKVSVRWRYQQTFDR